MGWIMALWELVVKGTFDSSGVTSLGTTSGTAVNIATAAGLTTVKGLLNVDKAVTLDETLEVAGKSTLSGSLAIVKDAATDNSDDVFTVDKANGNTDAIGIINLGTSKLL